MTPAQERLAGALVGARQARKRLMTTVGALQYRLRPATIASHAREGVKEKGRELAEDAIQVVKDRPVAVSGVAAGIALFLARGPILSAISNLWNRREPSDPSIVTADLDTHDENYDLTAPAVDWSKKEGASA